MKTEELQQIPAVIHVHTKVSGGAHTVSEITELARRNGIRAVLFSDKAERTFVYGAAPFRGILRVALRRESLKMSDVGGYLKAIDTAQSANPDVVLIPGLEVAPYYAWDGDPRSGNLTVRETDCELLVYGLKKESDWKNMPFISNPHAERFTAGSMARLLLCAVLLAAGAAMVIKKKKRVFYVGLRKKQRISRDTHPLRPAGVIVLFFALILTAMFFPFKMPPFSQYDKLSDRGAPYQLFADYVSQRSGISLWAHPDVKVRMRITKKLPLNGLVSMIPSARKEFTVTADCEGCSELVREVGGVTGFANLDLGGKKDHSEISRWDFSLARYARDGGTKPLWAEAERDFYGNKDDGEFADAQTVFLIEGKPTREKLLEALRKGRMYAARGHGGNMFRLREFRVSDGAGNAISGDTLTAKGNVRVSGVIDSAGNAGMKFRARLIGGDGPIREFSGRTPYTFDFKYDIREAGTYFRVEADDYANAALISNPIFVRKEM